MAPYAGNLRRLAYMRGADVGRAGQVGDGAGHFQDAGVGVGTQAQLLGSTAQQGEGCG